MISELLNKPHSKIVLWFDEDMYIADNSEVRAAIKEMIQNKQSKLYIIKKLVKNMQITVSVTIEILKRL